MILDEQCVAAESGAVREDHAFGVLGDLDVGQDLVGPPPNVDSRTLRHRCGVRVVDIARPRRLGLRACVTQLLDCSPVIKGQNEIRLGLGEPDVDEFLQLFRMFVGEVARLRPVLVDVEKLPLVLIEVTLTADRGVQSRGLPTVLPQAAGTEHGVVLTFLCGGCVGGVEAVAH